MTDWPDDKTKAAIQRLHKWSNPKAAGDPTMRMTQIWRHPIEMARDIRLLLEFALPAATGAPPS